MAEQLRWLALGYSVPVNPSKNRVYVWRKLKEYGAEYFKQGVAVLPYNRQSYTRFKYLSAKILEMGGEASIVEMKFMDPRDEKDMVARFRAQALEELSQLTTAPRYCASWLPAALPRIKASRSSG